MNPWTSKLSFLGRGAWALGIAAAAGAVIAYLLVPTLPAVGEPTTEAIEVRLLGQPLPLNDQSLGIALGRVRQYAASELHLKLPDGKTRDLPIGKLGAQIDKIRLTTLVREARDPNSLMRRHFAASGQKRPLELPVALELDPKDCERELLRLKDSADRQPADARMNLETRSLIPEVEGRLLDIDRTFVAIETALQRGERTAEVAFEPLKPKRVQAELGNVKFSHILGSFETRYDRSDKARDRTYNLRLAASKLDGHVLLPGETFDFNEIVGPRDEANGYRVATVIAEGELVDGLGGGTCQISGTLHGAVFFAGLEVVERVPHTRPSSYIKMGLDATVVYPTINFRFRNPYNHAVVLHQTVANGIVRAEILGPERNHTVTLIRRVTDFQPYEELEREDDRLPRGVKVLAQRGVAGFSINRYRIVREGAHAVRSRWQDKYPPTPQIIRVGTGDLPKDSVTVEDDRHPEYVADELLVMTQSSDPAERAESPEESGTEQSSDKDVEGGKGAVRKSASNRARVVEGGCSEWRQAGKTGFAGWTREQKMPQWESETDPKDPNSPPAKKSARDAKRASTAAQSEPRRKR